MQGLWGAGSLEGRAGRVLRPCLQVQDTKPGALKLDEQWDRCSWEWLLSIPTGMEPTKWELESLNFNISKTPAATATTKVISRGKSSMNTKTLVEKSLRNKIFAVSGHGPRNDFLITKRTGQLLKIVLYQFQGSSILVRYLYNL